jgi:hypothetical protein
MKCDTPGCNGTVYAYYTGTNKDGKKDYWYLCKLHERDVEDTVVL